MGARRNWRKNSKSSPPIPTVALDHQPISARVLLRAAGRSMFCLLLWSASTVLAQSASLKEAAQRADQGSADACYALGRIYERGEGQNYRKALHWYRKAAAQNVPGAQYSLGRMHAGGLGVRRNHTEALNWFRKAAQQNYAPAQNRLGVIFEQGQGVPRDNVEAYRWYTLAGSNIAALANREVLSRRMTAAEILEAERRLAATPHRAQPDLLTGFEPGVLRPAR